MTGNGDAEDETMMQRDGTTAALLNYDIMCKIAEAQKHGMRRADVLRVLEGIVEDVKSDLDYQTFLEDAKLLQTRTKR